MTKLIHTITLGVQSSGDDDRTGEHVLELRKLLAAHCKGRYSDEISEFALVLRVSGNMQEFDFDGCERIRRNRKDRYITVDLGFPSRKWHGVSDSEIRRYLADIVETGGQVDERFYECEEGFSWQWLTDVSFQSAHLVSALPEK